MSGIVVKSVIVASLASSLLLGMVPAPALAQDPLTARVLVDVCLPYAQRAKSFERAIRAARDLRFRRPHDDRAPLEEWASEVEMVSPDGTWRLRLEEGSEEIGDAQAYAVSCSLSSTRTSARQLGNLGRRAFGDERYWATESDMREWSRLTSRPDEYRLEVRVAEEDGERPRLIIRGLYF